MREWWSHILKGPIPSSLLVSAVFLAIAVWLGPVSSGESTSRIYDTPGALTPAAGDNVTAAVIGAYESASAHHLCVAEGVAAHYHRKHDETVTVLSGVGVLTVGEETREVQAGTVALIPRGTVHSLQVTGGPLEAVSVFSPAFDGTDRIYLDE
ncbi:MAG: hypothetical protein DHS20C21_16320 [Gemmatimonadota bacterium]|nr:MAG: hypothetical protein DHS20C21_16320 [Gemmatimonadota bacterium]